MATHYNSSHDLQRLSIGVPIQVVVKIKPNAGYYREDIKVASDRIGLLDVNNRIREDFGCDDIVDASTPLHSFFQEKCGQYVHAILEGVNISILGFGTTGSGKSFNIEGSQQSPGFLSFFAQAIFDNLEDKKLRLHSAEGYSYSVKMRCLEIVDECATDLLIQAKSRAIGNLELYNDEWEGNAVSNASWIPCGSAQHLIDIFHSARKNRTISSGEFGAYHDKSTAITTVEILQVSKSGQATSVFASRLYVVDTPGMEKLSHDAASIRAKEGENLNKAIYGIADTIASLAEGTYDHTVYEKSIVTSLLKDVVGGNCLTMAYFCLQNGDTIGSSLVLSYMRLMKQIINFPVINDSRQIGLTRRYRIEIKYLVHQLWLLGPRSIENFNSKIAELEKELIEGNLNKLGYYDDKVKLADKIRELKEAYNSMQKSKSDLEEELIRCEEERLNITKQYIDLQIEHSALEEKLSGTGYGINKKLIEAENELYSYKSKEDAAIKALSEMQTRLQTSMEKQRNMEIEFVSMKQNLKHTSQDLSEEKSKNDNLSLEVINLVNANKILSGDTDHLAKLKSNLSMDQERIVLENDRLRKQTQDLEGALLSSRSEIELLRKEVIKYDMNAQRLRVEFDSQKADLERQYLQITKNREDNVATRISETDGKFRKIAQQNQNVTADIALITSELKSATRKIAELEDNLKEYKQHDSEMTQEVHRLALQLEEMRGSLRGKLLKALNEGMHPGEEMMRAAREELVRTYNEKEVELTEKLNNELGKNAQNLKVIRGLRSYARSLKNLAEDWAPLGHPLPEVLILPPPILLDNQDTDPTTKLYKQELERVKLRNMHLEQEVKTLQSQVLSDAENFSKIGRGRDSGVQQKLMNEIQYLKGNNSRPGTSDVEALRKERNELREEIRKLHQDMRRGTPNEKALQDEIVKLRRKVGENEQGGYSREQGPPPKNLQQKMQYLEEVLKKLERERSELSVRATMAEEQLKNLQDHMNSSIQNYQRKIAELNRTIQQLRG